MNNTAENIYYLINNPLNVHSHILYFYSLFKGKENDLFLSYLILPMCLNKEIRENIKNLRIDSTMLSIVNDKERFKSIVGLQKIIEQYKDLTNICLQLDLIKNSIELDYIENRIHLKKPVIDYDDKSDIAKAVRGLAKVADKMDVVDTLKLLGVKKI
jgi:hypothetical protein